MSRKKERKNENYRVRMNSAAIRYLLPAFVWAFLSQDHIYIANLRRFSCSLARTLTFPAMEIL